MPVSQMSGPRENNRFSLDLEMGLMALLLIACAFLYLQTTIRVVRWNDPAAYVYAGRQLATVGAPVYVDENNSSVGPYFTLHGFSVRRSEAEPNFYATYPVGLPLLIALADRFLGPVVPAHLWVVPALALGGLTFLFALGRLLFGRWVGLLSAGLLALSIDYWTYGTETWSDVSATALARRDVLCHLGHATQQRSVGRSRWILAGLRMPHSLSLSAPLSPFGRLSPLDAARPALASPSPGCFGNYPGGLSGGHSPLQHSLLRRAPGKRL